MPDERKLISPVARRFVEQKFALFKKEAQKGCGLYDELYAQNFTDSVERLHAMAKHQGLKDYIGTEARKDCDYVPPEKGRWTYDHNIEDVRFSKPNAPQTLRQQGDHAEVKAFLERASTSSRETKIPVRSRNHEMER